jgi:hypothetical protein
MISIGAAVTIIVYLIVGGIVFGLLNLLIDKAPFMPEGWKPVMKWILLCLAILVLIGLLLSFFGGTPIFRA